MAHKGVARPIVEFFYDVASPYSYLAFEAILRYRSSWNLDLRLRPFFLGGVMKATGNRPPGHWPSKGKYMEEDLARLKTRFAVPMSFPKDLSVLTTSLPAQRLLTAASVESPGYLEELSRQLWLRIWARQQDIAAIESLREACRAAGVPEVEAEALLGKIGSPEVKERLKAVTDEAIQRGAFGAPAIFVKKAREDERWHHFFGSDRFEDIAFLLGKAWLGPTAPSQVDASSSRSFL